MDGNEVDSRGLENENEDEDILEAERCAVRTRGIRHTVLDEQPIQWEPQPARNRLFASRFEPHTFHS